MALPQWALWSWETESRTLTLMLWLPSWSQAFAVTPDVRTAMETTEPFALHGAVTRLQILALLKHRVRHS